MAVLRKMAQSVRVAAYYPHRPQPRCIPLGAVPQVLRPASVMAHATRRTPQRMCASRTIQSSSTARRTRCAFDHPKRTTADCAPWRAQRDPDRPFALAQATEVERSPEGIPRVLEGTAQCCGSEPTADSLDVRQVLPKRILEGGFVVSRTFGEYSPPEYPAPSVPHACVKCRFDAPLRRDVVACGATRLRYEQLGLLGSSRHNVFLCRWNGAHCVLKQAPLLHTPHGNPMVPQLGLAITTAEYGAPALLLREPGMPKVAHAPRRCRRHGSSVGCGMDHCCQRFGFGLLDSAQG